MDRILVLPLEIGIGSNSFEYIPGQAQGKQANYLMNDRNFSKLLQLCKNADYIVNLHCYQIP